MLKKFIRFQNYMKMEDKPLKTLQRTLITLQRINIRNLFNTTI